MMHMRICLYSDTALPKLGGQEFVVDALAREFLALGHEPVVFAPSPRKLSIRGEAYPYQVARHPRFISTRFLVSWYRWFLLQLYRKQPFDVLHCHGIYAPAYLASLLRDKLPVPVVVTSHGGDIYEDNVRLQKTVVRDRCVRGLRSADALVAISRVTRDGFARLCPEAAARIVDIPNGVHLAAFAQRALPPLGWDYNLTPGSYAVFLGRLKHRKGVDVLLHALTHISANGKTQLVVAGDGEDRRALERLANELGLHSRVRFLGSTTGQAKTYLLQNARFAIAPSRESEAFPLVVLEAYASGLPMLATDIPGLADLVESEKTGLLVASDAPEALAAGMRRLFTDDALAAHMSWHASQAVQNYDWTSVARRHVTLYEDVIAARTPVVEAHRVRVGQETGVKSQESGVTSDS